MITSGEKIRDYDKKVPPSNAGGSGPAGQPGVHDAALSGNGNCNWNPVWGRCMEQQKPSRKDMTAQPGRGENTSASTGSAARPRLGAEAVTNTGDAGYSANRPGTRRDWEHRRAAGSCPTNGSSPVAPPRQQRCRLPLPGTPHA
jgi:hypothetical protein